MRYSFAILATAVAVYASPMPEPQGVTSAIAPSAPAPSGCSMAYPSSFGIAVMNVTAAGSQAPVASQSDGQPTAGSAQPVSTISDGQPQASTGVAPVSQISDGQPQATTGVVPVSQISDGQIQATTMTMMPVNQITDGQIQNQVTVPAVSQISDGQPQATTGVVPVSQISDGQPQATTGVAPVSQISDGQPQATTGVAPVSQISDGQPQATTGVPAVSQISDGQPQASGVGQQSDGQPTASAGGAAATGGMTYVACQQSDSLQISLNNGVLKDNKGRTGYIASNYQFQFDDPPQAGAIYTSGFSVCSNGSLALGGSTTFYQCLSGSFYNLYNENYAPQCSPVNIEVVNLVSC